MYIYLISNGEYEQYIEDYFIHDKKFTEDEFKIMLKKATKMWYLVLKHYPNDYDIPSYTELLCILFGFKEMPVEVHLHDE